MHNSIGERKQDKWIDYEILIWMTMIIDKSIHFPDERMSKVMGEKQHCKHPQSS